MQILGRDILISTIITIIALNIYTKNKKKKTDSLCYVGIITLSLSMVVVFSLTGISPLSGFHTDIRINEISAIPFRGIIQMLQEGINLHAVINIVGNIAMFMPIGFLIPMLCDELDSYKKITLFGFTTSLAIELTQLFLIRGTDIDDLILNTLGAILGYLAFTIFKSIFSEFTAKFQTASKNISKNIIVSLGITIPYITIIICGFYDRFKL